jgi:hypothetical protein
MRLVSWNILAGGGRRCGTITARLLECDADVLVLQETVSTRGPDLCHSLSKPATSTGSARHAAPGSGVSACSRGSRSGGLASLCPGTRACILAGGSR